jgi:hypothetical protein
MTDRRILPQRRYAETFEFAWGGLERSYAVTLGFYDDGALGEVFITGGKSGEQVEAVARDGAVLLSLALQHGIPLGKHSGCDHARWDWRAVLDRRRCDRSTDQARKDGQAGHSRDRQNQARLGRRGGIPAPNAHAEISAQAAPIAVGKTQNEEPPMMWVLASIPFWILAGFFGFIGAVGAFITVSSRPMAMRLKREADLPSMLWGTALSLLASGVLAVIAAKVAS